MILHLIRTKTEPNKEYIRYFCFIFIKNTADTHRIICENVVAIRTYAN